jgi:hypothetical protein
LSLVDARHKPTAPLREKQRKGDEEERRDLLLNHHNHKQQPLQHKHETNK